MANWTLPQNNVTAGETGHLTDHDDIYGALNAVMSTVYPILPSGDATGATDVTNIQAALTAVSAGGMVTLAPGTFYINGQLAIPYNAVFAGSGPATVISCIGSPGGAQNAFLYWHSTTTPASGLPYAANRGGVLRDFSVDGTSASAGTTGLSWGDAWGMRIDGIRIANFTGAGSVGLWGINSYRWTEKHDVLIDIINCTTLAVFDTAAGQSSSWEYGNFDAHVFCAAGQNGVVIQNGAYLTGGGTFRLRGNITTGAGAGGTLLSITGSGGSGPVLSKIGSGVLVQLNAEYSGSGTPPQTIYFGGTGPTNYNIISDCIGTLEFGGTTWAPSNGVSGNLKFGGVILHDATLAAINTTPDGWA